MNDMKTCVCPSSKLHGPSCPLYASEPEGKQRKEVEVEQAKVLFESAKRRASFGSPTVTANDCSSG
eukprot:CAMPEP_0114128158 /NCGR_PEP_ID=MMETSP0043_2-20121206/10779_1 /TAXON_ID=464988 /ORGANISM="Hemiselmis andersenii, Strain CCMP644" /LENGTH=65 /DNA_ID=CAMNT_0001221321 /DNA_START=211 /DNA_END=408 /DNA_ORIENTATION=+